MKSATRGAVQVAGLRSLERRGTVVFRLRSVCDPFDVYYFGITLIRDFVVRLLRTRSKFMMSLRAVPKKLPHEGDICNPRTESQSNSSLQ
jgi:hypothetical protein